MIKDCVPWWVVPSMLALDSQLLRKLTLELWLLEVLSVLVPLVTICQSGVLEGSAVLDDP